MYHLKRNVRSLNSIFMYQDINKALFLHFNLFYVG